MTVKGIRRVNVRYDRREGEFTMRCDSCASAGNTKAYWPITTEFWDPGSGLQRCRACNNLARRKLRVQTIEQRRAKQRAYYRSHWEQRKAWRQANHAKHRDEINAKRRQVYAARKHADDPPGLWDG